MELTTREIEAVKESIEHWDNDILENFRRGGVIISNRFYDNQKGYLGLKYNYQLSQYELVWYFGEGHPDTGNEAKCFSDDCILCELYLEEDCQDCPYKKYYEMTCDGDIYDDDDDDENNIIESGYWAIFIDSCTFQNALNMRNSLARIIGAEEIK